MFYCCASCSKPYYIKIFTVQSMHPCQYLISWQNLSPGGHVCHNIVSSCKSYFIIILL